MAYNNVYRQFYGEIVGETNKAIKLMFCTNPEDVADLGIEPEHKFEWFPLSQLNSVHRFSKPDNTDLDILMATEWILKQKNVLHLAGPSTKPVLASTTTASAHPAVPSHPPAKSFVDMDDDIPY